MGQRYPPHALVVYTASVLFWAFLTRAWRALGLSSYLNREYSGLPNHQKILFNSHVISNLHALAAIYGGLVCYVCDDALNDPMLMAFNDSPARDTYLMITAGYLSHDLILCLYNQDTFGDALTIMHHALIVVAFITGTVVHIGTFYMASFLVNEVSTIFYNFNHFLAKSKDKHAAYYKANGLMLALTFLVFRICFNFYNLYLMGWNWYTLAYKRDMWRTETDTTRHVLAPFLSLLAVGHVVINVIWFFFICKAVARKLWRRSPEKTHVE